MSPLFAAILTIILIIVIFIALTIGVKNYQDMMDDREDVGNKGHHKPNNIGGDPATWGPKPSHNKNLGKDPRTWGPVTNWEGSQRFANSLSPP